MTIYQTYSHKAYRQGAQGTCNLECQPPVPEQNKVVNMISRSIVTLLAAFQVIRLLVGKRGPERRNIAICKYNL